MVNATLKLWCSNCRADSDHRLSKVIYPKGLQVEDRTPERVLSCEYICKRCHRTTLTNDRKWATAVVRDFQKAEKSSTPSSEFFVGNDGDDNNLSNESIGKEAMQGSSLNTRKTIGLLLFLFAFLLLFVGPTGWILALFLFLIGLALTIGRHARCYRCHSTIDRSTAAKCSACRWNICPRCGACGCQYRGRRRFR